MHKLTEQYKNDFTTYDDFKTKIDVLIRELLIQNGINFHQIESRTKDPIRLEEKINRKNQKYNELNELTDLVGLRIITYFEDEVDKVAQIIQSEFVLDKDKSIDKRELETDRFGYKSLHYIVSLKSDRKKLTEYKRFKDYKFEVQIRSILQHARAEIEHDIGYKGEISIPDIVKRDFYRVAALLETADKEFVNIRKSLDKYESTVDEDIKKHPEEVDLNIASLKSFIENNSIVKRLDKQIVEIKEMEFTTGRSSLLPLLEKLLFLKVRTIKDLETALKENQKTIPEFASEWIGKTAGLKVSPGISIFYLCYVLIGKTNNIELANTYYSEVLHKGINIERRGNQGKKIIDTYLKVTSG